MGRVLALPGLGYPDLLFRPTSLRYGARAMRLTAIARATLRDRVQRLSQRWARVGSALALEHLYQANYLALAERTPWLTEPPLAAPEGGTANYSLMFVLLAALNADFDGSPAIERVLELGVGRSSAIFDQWAVSGRGRVLHVDDSREWLERSVVTSDHVDALHAELVELRVGGRNIRWYGTTRPSDNFSLVLVDGPQAWARQNQFSRLGITTWLPGILADDYVIVIDDVARRGERELMREVTRLLAGAGHDATVSTVRGLSTQAVVASPRFEFVHYV